MDTSASLELVFTNKGDKKHKIKPMQFVSVAGGVQKRLETNVKHRKGTRLTVFDSVRNLSRNTSPVKEDAQAKYKDRRQQLEKWKQEKEKKKKELAASKKKPFVAGVVPVPLKFFLPPPPKPMPSTSGRVTRSQAAKAVTKQEKTKTQSFAPKNASFRPPQIKNMTVTILPSTKLPKDAKQVFTFDPVMPLVQDQKKTTNVRSKPVVNKQVTQEPIRRMNTRSRVVSNNANVTVVTNKITKSPKKSKKITNKLASLQVMESQVAITNRSPMTCTTLGRPPSVIRQYSSEEIRELDHDSPILPTTITPTRLTPKSSIPNSESQSEEKLRSPKDATVNATPQQTETKISPCVTLSRGKDNARREMMKKLKEGLLDEYASGMDSIQHFRRQLQSEIARITRHCEAWDVVYENTALPEFVQEQVLSTLGQARLLMSQKMQQFSSLVDRCETHDAGPRVNPDDLQGFWDMLYIQVVNLDLQFKKLDELRLRDWAEEAPAPAEQPAGRRPGARAGKRASKPASAPSRLKEVIAAARKAKLRESPSSTTAATPGGDCKTFEAGFFSVRSPVRCSPAPATPRPRPALLRSVLSSEAKKASATKQCASYAMLNASIISKNIDIEGIAPLEETSLSLSGRAQSSRVSFPAFTSPGIAAHAPTSQQTPKLPPINLDATPARSILKTNKASAKKPGIKTVKTVLFDDTDDVTTSGISSMDVEKEPENKENRHGKLVRQNALEISPVMTRSARKSMNTPKEEAKSPKRYSRRKKALQESECNVLYESKGNAESTKMKDTPRRSRRSKANDLIDLTTPDAKSKPRRRRDKASDV